MILTNPVYVNIKSFFLKGEFDCIKPGQTKEWILNNFPDPDSNWDNDYGQSIWTYNTLEFHFDKEELFLIWCDGLPYLESCKQITYQKWILDELSKLSLSHVLNILNSEFVDYKVKHNKNLDNVQIKILESGVILHFEQSEGNPFHSSNDYPLIAFGLSHHLYENF